MDYMKHAVRRTIGTQELSFIRCDKNGNVIPEEKLSELNFSNSTIERIVGAAAGRISGLGEAADGVYSDGLVTD